MSEETDLQARLAEIARIAVVLEAQTGCPAPMMIAQWAVESSWGAKPVGRANYFGIKANSRDPESCIVETEEVVNGKPVEEKLAFADYDSLADSAQDYAMLITEGAPYQAAWHNYLKTRDLNALITAVSAKYASDPSYAKLVLEISGQVNVMGAMKAAREVSVPA
jgi:flagellum-specific peptidoglycan hydrolase FlgJ